jgi:hypothetical protein
VICNDFFIVVVVALNIPSDFCLVTLNLTTGISDVAQFMK